MAAARLPETLRFKPRFSITSGYYTEKIFEQFGYPFDLRVCVKNFPIDHLISDQAVFEDLNFDQGVPDNENHEISLTITEHSTLDGFLIWLTLYTTPDEVIDILKSPHSWIPTFFPVFYPGLEVWPGDTIKAVCRRQLCTENQINPDYYIEGRVVRRHGNDVSFCYQSPHFQKSFKSTPFYEELFSGKSIIQNEDNWLEKGMSTKLRRAVERHLPNYMVPSAIVLLDRLPLTSNGKLDRKALPAPELGVPKDDCGHAGLRTPIEEIVVGIFGQVLKLDRVRRDDNFFEIGGNSLLAARAISQLRNAFRVGIGVRSIFEATTAAGLARKIEEAMKAREGRDALPPVKISREGRGTPRMPLTYAQQRLWLISQWLHNTALCNIPAVVRLKGRLDLEALERAVNEILRRHDVLRLRVEVEDGMPVQVIDKWECQRLEVEDLTNLSPEEREKELKKITSKALEKRFDLSRGPLHEAKALILGGEENVLLFTMHHIVSDEWSVEILNNEIRTLYQAYCAREPSPLDELHIQYADFAIWQSQEMGGEVMEEKMNYWKRQLECAPDLVLPVSNNLQRFETPKYASRVQVIQPEIARAIKTLREQKDVTLFMVLLTAFTIALHRFTGQKDLVIGTDIANRNRAEIESLIGCFVNEIFLRIKIDGDPTFDELLARVRETTFAGYLYQDIPFDRLVDILNPGRRSNDPSFIRAVFNMQSTPVNSPVLPASAIENVSDHTDLDQRLRCDFLLTYYERDRELVAHATYDAAIIQKSTVVALLRNIERALAIATDHPTLKLSALTSKLTGIQRRRQKQKIADSIGAIENAKRAV
jgi:hypothetical protein